MFDYLRDSSSLPQPPKQRTNWGRGGIWRGRGRKQTNKFSKIRTLSMIEKSGAYDREPLIAPTGKSAIMSKDLS